MRELTGSKGLHEIDMFKNIGKLKNGTDEHDPYYIHKVNCHSINGEPSFVFKTSRKAAELAIKMDINMQKEGFLSAMTEEYAFLDGMHSCTKGFKTLTLWTYHPGMWQVLQLCCMDAERENTKNVTLFLNLFNEVLQEVSGNAKYTFNPRGIMCDEAGANFLAIAEALGEDFLGKTVSCQWHFHQCAKKNTPKVNVNEQETFKSLFNELCYTHTATQFECICNSMHAICECNGILNWWNWWHSQRFHIVPAFQGFNLPGINFAEIGHSSMATRTPMSLAVAAWKDMCSMMIQDSLYDGFVNNTAKVCGKGLNLKQKLERETKADGKFVNEALEALNSGDIEAEAMIDMDADKFFEPSKQAKHKVPATYSDTNPQQQKHKSNKKKVNKDQNSSDSEEEERLKMFKAYSIVPKEVEADKLLQTPPHLVMLTSMVMKCSGCEFKFKPYEHRKPNDMVCQYMMYCKWPD